ncbi:MAG TPA: ATP cone domain-containing protein [Candidatus Woesebacteria bacterium]|nr:ATP cone domain-containing protein [Candidatus Woesebacteria bacterium]
MNCPYCKKQLTEVVNSRPTKHNSQVWRRRKCQNCNEIFTTKETIDLSHIHIEKKSGKTEVFSRMKLYSGIFYASQASKIPRREMFIDEITKEVEREILSLKKKKVSGGEIADIVLIKLKKKHTPTFLRYLTYCKDIINESQMKRELTKYVLDK